MKPLASPPVGFLSRLLSSSRDAWPCTWSSFPRKHLRQIWYRPHLTGTKRVPHIRYMKALMQGVLHYVVSVTENSPGSFTCQGQNLHSGKGKGPLEPPEHSVWASACATHQVSLLRVSQLLTATIPWWAGSMVGQPYMVYCHNQGLYTVTLVVTLLTSE